jgi:hypothetical protein
LETLIPANSSLHLATAATINDRGEINGVGVPLGIPVGNWVSEGHSFLLIPCDANHPGVAGCDYSLVDVEIKPSNNVAVQVTSQPASNLTGGQGRSRFSSFNRNTLSVRER